jgi:hypothetical protein
LPCNNSNENDVVGRYEGFYSDSLFYSDTIQIYNYTNNDGIINIYINNLRTIINCNKIGDTFTGTFTNRNFSFLNEDYNWISVNNSSGVINGTICAGKLNLTISFASGSLSSIYTGVTSFSGKVVSGVFFIKQ